MKVIFLENVNDYKVGEVKTVKDGYARNYLIPKGVAKPATEAEVKNLEGKIKKLKEEEAKNVEKAELIAAALAKLNLKLKEEVNEEGHLYGAVTAKEISEHLKKDKFEIEASEIVIEEPIKELGEYEIIVKVGHGVETTMKIKVERA